MSSSAPPLNKSVNVTSKNAYSKETKESILRIPEFRTCDVSDSMYSRECIQENVLQEIFLSTPHNDDQSCQQSVEEINISDDISADDNEIHLKFLDIKAKDDYTQIPKALDRRFEELNKVGSVRPTIINPGQVWLKQAQKALLAAPVSMSIDVSGQKSEKDQTFDLLDALSRSGGLTVDHASLHVVLMATHCFDEAIMDTVIKSNINPIEKVEQSTLIMATTIHEKPVDELVNADQVDRLLAITPGLNQQQISIL